MQAISSAYFFQEYCKSYMIIYTSIEYFTKYVILWKRRKENPQKLTQVCFKLNFIN